MTKAGLFFGSFNPVHIGHMIIANHILQNGGIDEVWFVVSPQNPFKERENLLPERQRYEMVRLAINDRPGFRVSDIEFQMPRPSYTSDTLAWLREKHPDHTFSLIMGEDSLRTLHKWKNAGEMVKVHSIIVYPRQEGRQRDLSVPMLEQARVHFCDAPVMGISSSYVRRMIANGQSPQYVLPGAVFRYVDEMNFYR